MAKKYDYSYTQPMGFMLPEVKWRPTPVCQLPSWKGAKRISYDIETDDPHLAELGPGVRRGASIVGFGFKIEDGPWHYLPIGHSEGNLPKEQVLRYMIDQAAEYDGDIVGANLQYDLDFSEEVGIKFRKVKRFRDIQIAEPLIDELQFSYSVDNIAARYGIPGKNEEVLQQALSAYGVTKAGGMKKIPSWFVAPYIEQDLTVPLVVIRRQERIIEERGLEGIYELESKLLPVLLAMRRKGVLIDTKRLERIDAWAGEEIQKACDIVRHETGITITPNDLNKPEALEKPLSAVGIELPRTATDKPSVKKDTLNKFEHPVAKAILRARKFDKLRGTFVQSIWKHLVNGRIHCTFNQMRKTADSDDDDEEGGRYGRLSCTDPNLQQQPSPDKDPEIGKPWRSIYIPEPGMKWAILDYSQQEPRLTVHFAEICAKVWEDKANRGGKYSAELRAAAEKAREAAHRYRSDPNTDNHTLMAQMIAGQGPDWKPSKKDRSDAKNIFLGLAYGMGGPKLARSLGLPTEYKFIERLGKSIEVAGPEAQALFDKFHNGVPFIRQLSWTCQDAVREKGYIKTILGRQLHFPEKPVEQRKHENDIYDWLHKALNRLIQGSAADQTKLAVLRIHEAGHELQLQVHDEVDLSVRDAAHAEEVAEIMRNVIPLRVPAKVDVEIGDSWGGAA